MNPLARLSELKKLVEETERKGLGTKNIVGETKLQELFQLIDHGVLEAESISLTIYGEERPTALKQLIYRGEEVLLDRLLDFRVRKSNTKNQAIKFSIFQEFVQLQFFEERHKLDLFLYYAMRLLRKLNNSPYHELRLLVSERLVYHYSFTHINKSLSDKYRRIYDDAIHKIELKRKLSATYFRLIDLLFSSRSRITSSVLKEIKDDLDEHMKSSSTSFEKIHNSRLRTSLYLYYTLKRDSQSMIDTCIDSLHFFEKNYPNSVNDRYMFTLRLGVAYLYDEEYTKARVKLEECLSMEPTVGTLHWNSTLSYLFTLEMLTENYQQAADILMKVSTTKEIQKLGDMWLQQWRIRSAYIHFLAKIGNVDLKEFSRRRVPNFKLGKFLNDVPLYTKDKRGLNLSILIAQIIILMADRRWDEIHDRIEALSKYSYRYLKNDSTMRSNSFIRMLISLAKADFNSIRAERYAEKYIKSLHTTSMNLNEYSTEIEIIPYERLWEIILSMTDGKNHKRKVAK